MTASDLVTNAEVEKPDEWPMRTAASFAPFITSGSRGWAKYYADHGNLFMRITNLKRHRIKPDLSDRQHVALPASEKEGLRTGLRQGDILISITADIGIIGYVDENVPTPAYINQHVACLRLPPDQVSPKFVAYYLASAEPQRRFIEMTDVGAKTGINLTTVGKLTFPCPPLNEQEAIAEALSDADALIEGLERLIAKKRLIKQGAMQDLLTARRRLPGFSGEWKTKKLGTICRLEMGGTPPRKNLAFWGKGHPWLSIADLKGKVVTESKEEVSQLGADRLTVVPKSTLIMSYKLSIGRVAFAGRDLYTNEAICAFFDLSENSGFLYYALQRVDFALYGKQAVKGYTLNKESLRSVELSFPSSAEQAAIAKALSDMDAEIQALETRLEKARAIKEGMMQNLLTGRIRLV